jgi:predicted nucleic-acid-binding Zn-ribbon protein
MTSRFCDNLGTPMKCRIVNVTLKHEAKPTAERSTIVNKQERRFLYKYCSRNSYGGKAEVREFKTCKIPRIPHVSIQSFQTRTFSWTWRTDSLHCIVLPSKWPLALTLDTRKLKIYLNNIYTSSWYFKKTPRLNYKNSGCCSLGKSRCTLWQ